MTAEPGDIVHARVFYRDNKIVTEVHILDDQPEVMQVMGALHLIRDLCNSFRPGVLEE